MIVNPAAMTAPAKGEREAWWHRGMREIFFRLLDPIVSGRSIRSAVDVSWGSGYFSGMLQDRYDWRVFPLAIGWEGTYGVERLARADAGALPFPDGAFDAALSIDIVGNVPRGQEAKPLGELTRLLAPKGLLVLRAPALELFHSRHSEFVGEQQRFTRERLIELAEASGIRVLRVSYMNTLLSPAALAKFRIWEPLMRKAPANGLLPVPWWLDKLLYAPLALESYWLGAGLNFPLGQTVLLIGEKAD